MTVNSILNQLESIQQKLSISPMTRETAKYLQKIFSQSLQLKISDVDKAEIFSRWTTQHKTEDLKEVFEILSKYRFVDVFTTDTWQDDTHCSLKKQKCAENKIITTSTSPTLLTKTIEHTLQSINKFTCCPSKIDPEVAKMTAHILKSDGFVKEGARDLNFDLRNNQTIAEVQGSSAFCKQVLQYASHTPSLLSPQYLRDQRSVNKTLCDTLIFKRIGHVFNQDKMLELGDRKVSMEGFNETFVSAMTRDLFDQFASARTDLVSKEMYSSISESLSKAIWHENLSEAKIEEIHKLIHNPDYPYPVCVGSGYVWHSTWAIIHCTKYGDFLFYCNRGAGHNGKPGIVILKIKNKTKITPEFLKRIASRLTVTYQQYTSLEKIEKELEAEVIDYIPMKAQKVGNCVYTSDKAKFLTLIFIENARKELEKNIEITKRQSPTPFTFSMKQEAKWIYKELVKFDKEFVLDDFLQSLDELHLDKIYGQDAKYSKALLTVAASVKDWALKHLGENKVDSELLDRALKLINSKL